MARESEKFEYSVQEDDDEMRLDHYLVDALKDVSRTRIQKLIKEGEIRINGQKVKSNYRLRTDDLITGSIPDAPVFRIEAEELPLDIVFEDDYLLVINKPAGMVVHPAVGNWHGTLLNGILYHVQQQNGEATKKPGLIHRLDKDTSGLIMAAKDDQTLNFMQNELKERRVKRRYQAIVWGHLNEEEGRIELPISRSPGDRRKMAVIESKTSRQAITRYKLISRYKFADHLDISLQTGRTHQIRVHLSHLGHPLVGDYDYGGDEKILSGLFDQYRSEARELIDMIGRQALHAYRLEFNHPQSGRIHTLKSELPEDMRKLIKYLQDIESKM